MARVRKPGESEGAGSGHGGVATGLGALLGARRFRLGAGADRVAQNLKQFGGEIANDAAAVIGTGRVADDVPSVALGNHAGTLGPRSFGFLNNVGGVAALDAPIPALPRRGSLALIVPARDALPDVVPLALQRGYGISWIISVGDGDPSPAIDFVSRDPATAHIAVALGPGASGAGLRQVLGAKPTVVLGGDPLCRAVVRRAGARAADRLDVFLAQAALLDADVEPGGKVLVAVVGGGEKFVAGAVARSRLDAELVVIDDRDPGAAVTELATRARAESLPLVMVLGGPPPSFVAPEGVRMLGADLRQPEALEALLSALAVPAVTAAEPPAKPRLDGDLRERVRAEVEGDLSDHDAKRLLKAYDVRVTRQAPTSTPTGAAKLAKTIGLPVLIVQGEDARQADGLPDVRRISALLLQADPTDNPSVMVREKFPEVPRTRARVLHERGLGHVMRIGEVCALLPLTSDDARALAQATAARRAQERDEVADLLLKISACATGENALFDLELFVGATPAVLSAKGELRR